MKNLAGLDYIVRPPKIEIENPPLLLLIHGYGSNEQDLFSFAHDLPPNFYIVSIRGRLGLPFGGFAWYSIDFINAEKFTNIPEGKESIESILNFIDEIIEQENLDKNKVWLCGFSQGAILSYALALNYPEKVNNIICLSGYIEPQLTGQLIQKEEHSKLRFFISHGKEDVVIPVTWARNAENVLKPLNIKYEYHEYNSGHGINPQNYYDLMAWIKKENEKDIC